MINGMVISAAIFLAVAIFFCALGWAIGAIRERRRKSRRYPAIVPGGLSDNPQAAAEQAADCWSWLRFPPIVGAERGFFSRDAGPEKMLVLMYFADYRGRRVHLQDGEHCYRFIRDDGTVLHCRQKDGRAFFFSSLKPSGWRFEVIERWGAFLPAFLKEKSATSPAGEVAKIVDAGEGMTLPRA